MTRALRVFAHGKQRLDVFGLAGQEDSVLWHQAHFFGVAVERHVSLGKRRVGLPVAAPPAERARADLVHGPGLSSVKRGGLEIRDEVPVRGSDPDGTGLPGGCRELQGQRQRTRVGAQGDVADGVAGPSPREDYGLYVGRRHGQGPA